MKILFISDNFPPERNACASRVYERACYWIKWGHEVTVLTAAPNFPEGKLFEGYRNRWHSVEDMDGIRLVRVKTLIAPNKGVVLRLLDFLSFMMASSIAGVFEQRPDVVVATSPQFFSAVAGSFLATVKGVPFIFELSDLWPASIKAVGAMRSGPGLRAVEALELYLYRHSARVVALTEAFRDDLVARGIDPQTITVIVNGADMSRYAPRPRNPEIARRLGLTGRFVVGYIGTHGMAHALERVLEAAEILRGDDSVRFLFVGAGAAREQLIRKAQRLGLTNVVFVSSQPKESMPDYWSLCDVVLVHLKDTPLFSTVIPSKIFEAMAMGLPIVLAAPDGEAADIVRSNNAGLVLPPERPAELAEAVISLAASAELRSQFAGNSLAAAPSYTREKQAREMLNVFLETIGTRTSSFSTTRPSVDDAASITSLSHNLLAEPPERGDSQ